MKIFDKICRSYLKHRGYIISGHTAKEVDGEFALVEYTSSDGRFDYQKYVDIQMAGNKRKIENVWANEVTIEFISDYIRSEYPKVKKGLCHGSRNGTEVKWFAEKLGADVIGTDISDTATDFGLVKWDFHDTNPKWVGKFDFVYTNSHDHSYDPKKSFKAWIDQLKPGGTLFIEHSHQHSVSGVTELDPFGIDYRALPYFVLNISDGTFGVTKILQMEDNGRKYPTWIFTTKTTSEHRGLRSTKRSH